MRILAILCIAAGVISAQTVAPNPGGAVVETNSTSAIIQYVPVTESVNTYSTTITATLNGSVVFSHTYAAPYSDPSVQSAIAQADEVLQGGGATYGTPQLASNSTELQGSATTTPSPVTCDQAYDGAGVAVVATNSTAVTFGPATINVDQCQDEIFYVNPGQADINVNQAFTFNVSQNVVTTNTYLTTQTYTIQGTGGVAYSPCDINRDGITNVIDVQDILNQASGLSPPASDLNGDGAVNMVDIQFVIDASLNLGCAAAPLSVSMAVDVLHPAGLAVDAAGNLYVADPGNRRIRKVSPSGTISTVADDLDPAGIAADAAGNLYIADSANHRILKLSANGALSTVVSGLDHPLGVAVDAAGKLYIADTFSAIAARVYHPTGIAVDRKGNLYIADRDNHRVLRNAFTVADHVDPAGIAVDRDGNLYIADSANKRIRKVAPNGTISTVAADGIDYPSAIAVDAAGNLFVADEYNQLIRKLGRP